MSYIVGQCAARGNLKHLKILIERDRNSVHDFDGCGQTPLHLAAWAGHAEVCRFLLSKVYTEPLA
jgi:ankyrin repeat protein